MAQLSTLMGNTVLVGPISDTLRYQLLKGAKNQPSTVGATPVTEKTSQYERDIAHKHLKNVCATLTGEQRKQVRNLGQTIGVKRSILNTWRGEDERIGGLFFALAIGLSMIALYATLSLGVTWPLAILVVPPLFALTFALDQLVQSKYVTFANGYNFIITRSGLPPIYWCALQREFPLQNTELRAKPNNAIPMPLKNGLECQLADTINITTASPAVQTRVTSILTTNTQLANHMFGQADDPIAFESNRIISNELTQTLIPYLKLPADFRETRILVSGKTTEVETLDQLDVLNTKISNLLDEALARTANNVISNGIYLHTKYNNVENPLNI